ncbi:iron-containing redox enzyme family protein [unidentified bacterial endosymbiont]|uniref:iron-containing redox enzyme family protein n=1 Tax=unidentified bacterial endosymbiont TaxID=2355 RepID=UPI003F51213B
MISKNASLSVIDREFALKSENKLDTLFLQLIDSNDINSILELRPQLTQQLMRLASQASLAAFEHHDDEALRQVHQTLFYAYHSHLAEPLSCSSRNQYHPVLLQVRTFLESQWLYSEKRRARMHALSLSAQNIIAELHLLWKNHAVSSHALFDFLEHEANSQQLYYFFKSDSALNLLFFDLVAMTLVGSFPETRGEISQNLWDEIGQGSNEFTHVNLYKDLLHRRGIDLPDDHYTHLYDWQGLAGYNLFMMGGVTRCHYYKLIGMMAMTELLDPSQYEKLVNGSRRLGLSARDVHYYSEHISVDVDHADGWLNNVIVPVAQRYPQALEEIYFGARLRLQTCQDYYDNLLKTLKAL